MGKKISVKPVILALALGSGLAASASCFAVTVAGNCDQINQQIAANADQMYQAAHNGYMNDIGQAPTISGCLTSLDALNVNVSSFSLSSMISGLISQVEQAAMNKVCSVANNTVNNVTSSTMSQINNGASSATGGYVNSVVNGGGNATNIGGNVGGQITNGTGNAASGALNNVFGQ